jgi:hypothetical protein
LSRPWKGYYKDKKKLGWGSSSASWEYCNWSPRKKGLILEVLTYHVGPLAPKKTEIMVKRQEHSYVGKRDRKHFSLSSGYRSEL